MKITIKTGVTVPLLVFLAMTLNAQTSSSLVKNSDSQFTNTNRMIEIRSYNLKPGTRNEFHKLFLEKALPLLRKWKVEVITFGPSLHDEDSYFLVRSYKDLQNMQESEDAFYGSEDWKKGPREAILSLIVNYTTIVLPATATNDLSNKISGMETPTLQKTDSEQLSDLNAQFIKNFINEDVAAHNEIIHKNFVCIEGDGSILDRATYMSNWSRDFAHGGYSSFSYDDERIRIFGNVALVRSKTTYTKTVDGKNITGHSIYTDTYVKETGRWWCIQAQITPVKIKK